MRLLVLAVAVWLGWAFIAGGLAWLAYRAYQRLATWLERWSENRAWEREIHEAEERLAKTTSSPHMPPPVLTPTYYRLEEAWRMPARKPRRRTAR